MPEILKLKLLVVIRLLFIYIEICTVEIEEAVRQLVTSERSDHKIALVAGIHHALRQSAPWCWIRMLSQLDLLVGRISFIFLTISRAPTFHSFLYLLYNE